MTITGSSRGFALIEVMKLIADRAQGGAFSLTSGGDEAWIAFNGGMITAALYGRDGRFDQLQDYLYRMGLIGQEAKAEINGMRERQGMSFEAALRHCGLEKREDIARIINFKIQEILDEILTWGEVSYTFDPQSSLYVRSFMQASLKAEELIEQTRRRRDEWKQLALSLPPEAAVLARTFKPVDLQLSRDQQAIYELILRPDTVREAIVRSGLGRYRALHAIAFLVGNGLLQAQPDAATQR